MDNNNFNQTHIIDDNPNNIPLTVGQWIITMLVLAIPCLGIIMLFVWGFGEGNINRKRFCQASLIFAVISFVVSFVISMIILAVTGGTIFEMLKNAGALESVIRFIK